MGLRFCGMVPRGAKTPRSRRPVDDRCPAVVLGDGGVGARRRRDAERDGDPRVRAGLGLLVMASLATARADLRAKLFSRHLVLHVFRNTVHVGSSYLWATSLLLIPMAMTFALEFTTPAWTLLL